MKKLIKKLLPAPVLEAIWAFRKFDSWFARRVLANHLEQPRLKREYERLNASLPEHVLVLPHGTIRLNVIPEVRRVFELYSHIDMRNVCEMRGFVKYARDRRCLLDIGALYGDFALVFCAMTGGRAYAVDPSPEAQQVLAKLIAANPQAQITPCSIALGSENAVRKMAFEWIHCVSVEGAANQDKCISVQEQTLDDFIRTVPEIPDVVKIDAEGAELDILRGGAKFFSEHAPRLFIEVHPTYLERRGQTVAQFLEQLGQFGYHVFHSDGAPVRNPKKVLSQAEGYLVHRVICDKQPVLPR